MVIESGDLTDENVIASMESALLAELNIHPSNLDLSFDQEVGIITYVISSDDMGSVANAITIIANEEFISNLDIREEISIESIDTASDIVATVDVVVDASNVSDANIVAATVQESLHDQDDSYEITNEGIIYNNVVLKIIP